MHSIVETAIFLVAASLAVAFCVPLVVGFVYFLFLRLRARDERLTRQRLRRCREFVRFANRAMIVFAGLFFLTLVVQYVQIRWRGYLSAWLLGFVAVTPAVITLLVLLMLAGTYAGYGLASIPLPRRSLWAASGRAQHPSLPHRNNVPAQEAATDTLPPRLP